MILKRKSYIEWGSRDWDIRVGGRRIRVGEFGFEGFRIGVGRRMEGSGESSLVFLVEFWGRVSVWEEIVGL